MIESDMRNEDDQWRGQRRNSERGVGPMIVTQDRQTHQHLW